MSPSLRVHFGSLAGSLAHAAALLTLARVAAMDGGDGHVPLPDPTPPASDWEAQQRLAAMLEELVALTGVSEAELRAEGFPEGALRGLAGSVTRRQAPRRTALLPRYDAALRILQEVLQ
ncbi:MAG: hypothetical protein RLZ32_2309 [Gemmatimonadota bacterium]|jgi:hypothetical protein